MLATKKILALLLLLACPVLAQNWQGTWSSSFGELRLHEAGPYVIGEYGNQGVLVGRKRFDLVQGVFTDFGRTKAGTFTFKDEGGKFVGSRRFGAQAPLGDWNGRRLRKDSPPLRVYSRSRKTFTPITNNRKIVDGTYNSSFGPIRLQTINNFLVGDYGSKGILVGVWEGNKYVGQFTNGTRPGWFEFEFLSRDGSFRAGRWGWLGDNKVGTWNLNRVSTTTPTIANLVPKTSGNTAYIDATQEPTRRPNNNNNNNNNNQQNQNNPPRPAPRKTFLSRTKQYNTARAKTIMAQQYHVKWVSEPSEQKVLELVEGDGYKVVGGSLITSEIDAPVLRALTTERLRCYVAVRDQDVVICFRGSKAKGLQTGMNTATDLAGSLTPMSFVGRNSRGAAQGAMAFVHRGFNVGYYRLRGQILSAIDQHHGKNVYVFGHSLGGALATLCALDIGINRTRDVQSLTLITSGAPRVGDKDFYSYFQRAVRNALRIEVAGDPIPMVPPQTLPIPPKFRKYEHVGALLPLYNNGTIVQSGGLKKRLRQSDFGNHSNENYFSVVKSFYESAIQPNYFRNKANLFESRGHEERQPG